MNKNWFVIGSESLDFMNKYIEEIQESFCCNQYMECGESEAIRSALGFMSLALHTSDTWKRSLKQKRDANLRDVE